MILLFIDVIVNTLQTDIEVVLCGDGFVDDKFGLAESHAQVIFKGVEIGEDAGEVHLVGFDFDVFDVVEAGVGVFLGGLEGLETFEEFGDVNIEAFFVVDDVFNRR